ncbi:MAG: hypothetical protein ACREMH_09930 [Gemmatimonadales bacterium]
MRRFLMLATLGLTAAGSLAAQSAPRTRDDSLAVGRKIVALVYDGQTDSLWNRMGPELKQMMTDKAGLQQQIDQIAIGFGTEMQVGEETVGAKDGNLVYTREVLFDGRPNDWAVWYFTVAPDGTILSGDFRPKGAPPPAGAAKPDSAAKPAPAPGTK